MSLRTSMLGLAAVGLLVAQWTARAAEVIFPPTRQAYFVEEPIEIALSGLDRGEKAAVELLPDAAGLSPVRFQAAGDGSTLSFRLPPYRLAPGSYTIQIDGVPQKEKLRVSRGVHASTLYVSQTMRADQLAAAGGNFAVSNAFEFGLLDHEGMPSGELRRRSGGMNAQESLVATDYPALIYMYWTGYVLHKPWGDRKSWAAGDMTENMRLFSFHVAQRLRRYQRNLLSVGTIDEPGLAWGKTPEGHMATGFPNWDERPWYQARGWQWTNDPASRPDDDWLKYTAIRCGILGEQTAQARRDLQAVCPDLVFSTDLYAPGAFMDGTDPWNQRVNQIPSTHVFADWGFGKLGVMGGLYIEKAHDPGAKVAHAMNGQLFAPRVPQPQTRYAYHLMLNSMLAAGLKSNWWLNYGGMEPEDLRAVNEPAARIGPLLAEMGPADHDTAILWSFTEISLRCKEITAQEASRKAGEEIRMTVTGLPKNSAFETREISINAYSVGGNYRQQVLTMHQALNRAGYPAHVLHERLLPTGALKSYRTLVIVGQTRDLPADVRRAVEAFVAGGGKLVVDSTTRIPFDGPLVVDAGLKDASYRWEALFNAKQDEFDTPREASYFKTNHFMDSFARKAVPAVKAVMGKTDSRPVIATDSAFLGCERHVGGQAELHMVLNAYEELPEIGGDKQHLIYNYAPYHASYTLPRIESDRVVYRIEGLDWTKVTRVEDSTRPQTAEFEPGEMKLYLAAPRPPQRVQLAAAAEVGRLRVNAQLESLAVPWPITVTIADPGGAEIIRVFRSMNAQGKYAETFPLGVNAPAGPYRVRVQSPVANLIAEATVAVEERKVDVEQLDQSVRVFDGPAMASFLAARPPLVVAVGSGAHQAAAERLAAGLRSLGIPARVAQEASVWRKALYPRVWDPYITVYHPTPGDLDLSGRKIQRELSIETVGYNHHVLRDEKGKEVEGGWREPGALLTVAGQGLAIEAQGRFDAYEPGCKLYVDDQRKLAVLNGEPAETQTTEVVRRRWSRPWHRLQTHVGAWHLVPQLPEAYSADSHLILLGDSITSHLIRALQASELLEQVVDGSYPGPGKSLVSFAWSPFALEKNVILVGATDEAGLSEGIDRLLEIAAAATGPTESTRTLQNVRVGRVSRPKPRRSRNRFGTLHQQSTANIDARSAFHTGSDGSGDPSYTFPMQLASQPPDAGSARSFHRRSNDARPIAIW